MEEYKDPIPGKGAEVVFTLEVTLMQLRRNWSSIRLGITTDWASRATSRRAEGWEKMVGFYRTTSHLDAVAIERQLLGDGWTFDDGSLSSYLGRGGGLLECGETYWIYVLLGGGRTRDRVRSSEGSQGGESH